MTPEGEDQRVPQCHQQIEAFVYGDEVVDGECARVGKGTGDGGVWLGLKCTDDHVPEGEQKDECPDEEARRG